ncbi:hypothetical protein C0989_001867, partial [Termitomyces sp. Mn162]
MLVALICNGGLTPEVNTMEKFVLEAKAYKNSIKTAVHHLECNIKSRSGQTLLLATVQSPVEDAEDEDQAWMTNSMPNDHSSLLLLEEEYHGTLQEGKQRVPQPSKVPKLAEQVPPKVEVSQQLGKRTQNDPPDFREQRIWDRPIPKPKL